MDEKNMTEQVDETSASEESAEETTEESQDLTEESSEDIDYRAELERELLAKEKQLTQAEYTIKKLKKKKREPDFDSDEDDYKDAEKLGAEEIREIIREENQVFYNKTREENLKAKIRAMSSSDAEADLIFYHLGNSIRVTGDDAKDIANARLLANSKRYWAELVERDRSVKSGASKITASATSQRVNKSESGVKLSPQEEKLARSMDPTGTKGVAKKMLEAKIKEMS